MLNNNESALEILESYKSFLWPEIRKDLKNPDFPALFKTKKDYLKEEKFHWKVVSDYPERRGKYLRPTLLILTAEALGVAKEISKNTACAMQISEEWLLIHDDLEDHSLQRRGNDTLNVLYGYELAVNAGDVLHAIMWHVLEKNKNVLDPETKSRINDELFRILMKTMLGQTVELEWARKSKIFTDEDCFYLMEGKTAYYTIAGPMRLGAIIAGANPSQLEKIAQFGKYLGRCFQLVDDILDLTSDFGGLKKQTGNDIYEGKKTIMLGHLLRESNLEDRKKIKLILLKEREEKTQKEVDFVIDRMKFYGSIEYARVLAGQFKTKALGIFDKDLQFLSQQPARRKLEALINFVLERKK